MINFNLFFMSEAWWWRLRMRDRKVERINVRWVPLGLAKELYGMPLADFGRFGVAPNNSLITVRDDGTDEIFAVDWEAP